MISSRDWLSWVTDVTTLQSDWTGLLFSCRRYFFPHLFSSSYFLPLFHCLIFILLIPCGGVSKNTRAWVPHFLLPYWMELALFGTNHLLWWRACYQKLNYKLQTKVINWTSRNHSKLWNSWLDLHLIHVMEITDLLIQRDE